MLTIAAASDAERRWAAELMAASEPWLSLQRTAEACLEVLFDPRHRVLVATEAGRPLGVAVVDPKGLAGAPYLKSIVVEPSSRSRGIGGTLLAQVERETGGPAGNLFLCVSSFNVRARALYERKGYAVVGELQDFIVAGASELIMRRQLGRGGD